MWDELGSYLIQQGAKTPGPCFSLYHDDEYKERDWDIEVCEPLASDLKESDHVKVKELPAIANMACTVHQGPFVSIGQAYDAIVKWISQNGYRIVGPPREVYLREAKDGSQIDPDTLTEIQFPIEK
jgi:effector-binding domain-containing protein